MDRKPITNSLTPTDIISLIDVQTMLKEYLKKNTSFFHLTKRANIQTILRAIDRVIDAINNISDFKKKSMVFSIKNTLLNYILKIEASGEFALKDDFAKFTSEELPSFFTEIHQLIMSISQQPDTTDASSIRREIEAKRKEKEKQPPQPHT